jgi:hypothetical protein
MSSAVEPSEPSSPLTITFTGVWQYVTVGGTCSLTETGKAVWEFVNQTGNPSVTFLATRANVEFNTATPTTYCKTTNVLVGAMSRFAAGVKVNFPLQPPSPTVTFDSTNAAQPILTVVLPAVLQDVWGVEIRASNNVTVLYKKDLTDASFLPTFTYDNSALARSMPFFVYTYNLLGEYSATYNPTLTIPTPTVTTPAVNDLTAGVTWVGTNATKYLVQIATDASMTALVLSSFTTGTQITLADPDFFPQRYIKVTPYDAIGAGTASSVVSHIYVATGPFSLGSGEAGAIGPPAAPGTDFTVPAVLNDYRQEILDRSWKNYRMNVDRYS